MRYVDIKKTYDRVSRKKMMDWVIRKNGLPEVIVREVMNLYHGAKKVKVGSELSEEFWEQVDVQQGSV